MNDLTLPSTPEEQEHSTPPKSLKKAAEKSVALHDDDTHHRLTVINVALNKAIFDVIEPAARAAGSSAPIGVRYKHYHDATAKAVFPDLKRSDAETIALMPETDRRILALVRHGLGPRLPALLEEATAAGAIKPYKAAYAKAKEWAATEALQLRALLPEVLAQRLETEVPLLESSPEDGCHE